MCFFFCLNHKIVTDSRRTSSTTCTFSFNFCGARGAYRLTVSVQPHASTSGNSFNGTPFRTRINAHIWWSRTGDNQQYAVFQCFFERCPGVSDRSVFTEENIFPVLSSLGYQDSSHRFRRRDHMSISFLSQKTGLRLSENRSDSSANAEHCLFPIL